MSKFYLMNKTRKLLMFEVVIEDGDYDCVERERYVGDNELPPRFTDIYTWVDNRNYAKHKEHLQKWLREWQIDNAKGFLEMTHALSLNDSLWVKPVESDLAWERMNLYDNEFTDVVSKTAFEKGLQGLKLSSTSPEFTSEGSFEKCWMREEDGVFLYKKGASGFANAGKEPYSEYYASQYSSALCRSYVDYDLMMFKGALVSRCRMFTSADRGFVPIYKYLDGEKKYRFRDIIEFLKPYGFEKDFKRMIVLDAVIMNPDRHFGNFGFIVDNDTFEVLDFAPVFDHNMSMLARAMACDMEEIDSPYILELGHKLGPDFIPPARAFADDETRRILRELREQPLRLHPSYNPEKERTDFLEKQVWHQIDGILEK